MKKIVVSAVVSTAIMSSVSCVSADEGINILDNVKVSGELRPRFEATDKKNDSKKSAKSLTNRTRLAVSTDSLAGVEGLNAKIALTSVNNFGYTNYNTPGGTDTNYEVIADAQQAMLSEGFVSYTANDTTVIAGRSHINLDDQRFIGTVGWRQMERAYDTVTAVNKSVEGLTLLGSWVYGFAGVGSTTTADTGSALINANYKVNDNLTISAFDYMLANIHDTYGLRVTGKAPLGDIKLNYAASYALQTDNSLKYGANGATNTIDASYLDIAVGANMDGLILGAEYEVLGKSNVTGSAGFTTPLATLHKFQGFADEFLAANNTNGLTDMSVKVGYADKSLGKVVAFYHKFGAETGAATDLGSELDAVYSNKISGVNGLKGLLKLAMFKAGEAGSGHAQDNTKVWAQLDYKFATK